MNNYKEEIERLENDCIKDWETAFNKYLLMDLSEAGEIELITELDTYLFWLMNARSINSILYNLINVSSNDELMLKIITIKRVIDANLIRYGNSEKEILEDLGINEINNKSGIIEIKFQGDDKSTFLKGLYEQLIKDEYIDSDFDVFNSNFYVSSNSKPINWIGSIKLLAGLMKFLSRKNIISKKRTEAKIICSNFLIKGNVPKYKSIGVTLSDADERDSIYSSYLKLIEA